MQSVDEKRLTTQTRTMFLVRKVGPLAVLLEISLVARHRLSALNYRLSLKALDRLLDLGSDTLPTPSVDDLRACTWLSDPDLTEEQLMHAIATLAYCLDEVIGDEATSDADLAILQAVTEPLWEIVDTMLVKLDILA